MTVDATAATSAGSTVSHYRIAKAMIRDYFSGVRAKESVIAYCALPRH